MGFAVRSAAHSLFKLVLSLSSLLLQDVLISSSSLFARVGWMVCLLVQRKEIAKILHSSIPFNFVFIVLHFFCYKLCCVPAMMPYVMFQVGGGVKVCKRLFC